MSDDDKLTGMRVAELYQAAKLHFTSDYDVLKYHWKVPLSEEGFRAHKNRFIFERIAREYSPEWRFKQALGAVFYEQPKANIRDFRGINVVAENAITWYTVWSHMFRDDYKHLLETWNDIGHFMSYGFDSHVARQLMEGIIAPQSAAIYFDMVGWDHLGDYGPIRKITHLQKYSAFIAYDKAKVAEIMKKCQSAHK